MVFKISMFLSTSIKKIPYKILMNSEYIWLILSIFIRKKLCLIIVFVLLFII